MAVSPDAVGLFGGAVALGAVHGIEPGHGWPVAASYALDRTNEWAYGLAASLLIGVGHLLSSVAMVGAFFYAKSYFDLARINEPIELSVLSTTVAIGGPVSLVAGALLLALGWREYNRGHSRGDHDHGHATGAHDHDDHEHGPDDHDHDHGHEGEHEHRQPDAGHVARLQAVLPFVGGSTHSHDAPGVAADRGLFGIAWFAFVLGFAHEEEFEIIALCAGSTYCLELMAVYALTVVAGIVGLTLLLIAGYQRYEERVERYTPYLPAFSAAVLVVMGLGFIIGLF